MHSFNRVRAATLAGLLALAAAASEGQTLHSGGEALLQAGANSPQRVQVDYWFAQGRFRLDLQGDQSLGRLALSCEDRRCWLVEPGPAPRVFRPAPGNAPQAAVRLLSSSTDLSYRIAFSSGAEPRPVSIERLKDGAVVARLELAFASTIVDGRTVLLPSRLALRTGSAQGPGAIAVGGARLSRPAPEKSGNVFSPDGLLTPEAQ